MKSLREKAEAAKRDYVKYGEPCGESYLDSAGRSDALFMFASTVTNPDVILELLDLLECAKKVLKRNAYCQLFDYTPDFVCDCSGCTAKRFLERLKEKNL